MSFPAVTITNGTQAQSLLQNNAQAAGFSQPSGGLSQLDTLAAVLSQLLTDLPAGINISVTTGVASSSSIKSSSASAGVGYATGAGGTITQTSSITTGVTLNKICGQITTVSSTLAASTNATFTVTNSSVATTDAVDVWVASTSSAGLPNAVCTAVGSGSFNVTLQNIHASAALNNTVTIGFCVTKCVTA